MPRSKTRPLTISPKDNVHLPPSQHLVDFVLDDTRILPTVYELSFVQTHREESYEWATPSDNWSTGAPFGLTEALMMVRLGDKPRIAETDAGGNFAASFFTSLCTLVCTLVSPHHSG